MKINSKGMTLVELLVSIVLISVVLVFLFQLLNDLENTSDSTNYAYDNQLIRAEIIYTIERDLQDNKLAEIKKEENKYVFGDGLVELEINGSTIAYTDYSGDKHKWEMKDAKIGNPKFDSISNEYGIYYKLIIPIYNEVEHNYNNEDKNNSIDDIEIFSYKKA